MSNPYASPATAESDFAGKPDASRNASRRTRWVVFLTLLAAAPTCLAITLVSTTPTPASASIEVESVRQIAFRYAASGGMFAMLFASMIVPSLSSRGRSRWLLVGLAASVHLATVLVISFAPH